MDKLDKLLEALRNWTGNLTGQGFGRRTRDAIREDLRRAYPAKADKKKESDNE